MMDKKNWWVALAASMLVTTSACAADAASAPSSAVPSSQANCRPEYPPAAVRAQVQGVTVLDFHINAEGQLTLVEIKGSSGRTREHKMLDMEAARALSRCPFKAAVDADGKPIESVMRVNYTWRLE